MIPVTLNTLIFLYLALMLGLIFGAWLSSGWRRSRREKNAYRHVLRCSLCGFEFEDKSPEPTCRCPRCASLNERSRISRL